MKTRHALFALAFATLLAGCTSPGVYYEPMIPRADVGAGAPDDGGWRPYTPAQSARPEDREWRPSNPDWGRDRPEPREQAVRREALPEPTERNTVQEGRPEVPAAKPSFDRAEPRDPPSDLSTRRVYSSRPERNPRRAADDSAFGTSASSTEVQAAPRGVRSEWADKAVRGDNRPGFDRMVRESAARGSGSYEDEAGRIYYGEVVGRDGGCSVVEVTVTTNGGLPVVSRGTAYDCR
ncbi:hypothetical protein OIU34_17895 [Pararhizobium sp. BT-229]|uniref:hypothetical protein n=1 Tax=Pararhizobium sp. BT-229 TaxID=2986923 RepID=UPI0021F703AE|nr:hypothetical protein [Pararhizobium sp. BT-229]MCV9963751.1 hypothetical protein [Pararhizobium sp. BT-229]